MWLLWVAGRPACVVPENWLYEDLKLSLLEEHETVSR